MLKYRIISFPVLMAVLFTVFCLPEYGNYVFTILATLLVGAVLFECGRLFNNMGIVNFPLLSSFLGGITALTALTTVAMSLGKFPQSSIPLYYIFIIVIMLPIIMIWGSVLFHHGEFFRRVIGSFGIFASLGSSMILLSLLYFLQGDAGKAQSNLLFYVCLTAKGMDIGGYIFGMTSARLLPGGNHKIAPTFSPKKSWEGFFGGVLFSVGISLIFWKLSSGYYSWYLYLVSGVILGILSFFGDLTESGIKRSAGVKDSAGYIPGMGGVFDVLDSFIYIGPIAAIVYAAAQLCNI